MKKIILMVSLLSICINASNKNPEIVRGYVLPPKPNPKINNSTLLGIDSNNNMLRDDVERWIVKEHPDWSDNQIAASFQKARGYQLIFNEDMGNNVRKSTLKNMAIDAGNSIIGKELNKELSLKEILENNRLFIEKIFNTKDRKEKYKKYNKSFSGKIIHSFPNAGSYAYKYIDYAMEDGTLNTYEFTGEDRYYNNNKIPLYGDKALITSYWSLEKNKNIGIDGNFEDKFCEINFGIEKNGLECSNALIKHLEHLEKGLMK